VEVGGEVPDLIHPYFDSTDDVAVRAKLLDDKIAELKREQKQ
jgi:hypothetical protein